MPKKKSPTFVTEGEMTFALNRAARRLAARHGIPCVSVPMPQLIVDGKGVSGPRKYYLQHITGQLADYTPYYHAPKQARE